MCLKNSFSSTFLTINKKKQILKHFTKFNPEKGKLESTSKPHSLLKKDSFCHG